MSTGFIVQDNDCHNRRKKLGGRWLKAIATPIVATCAVGCFNAMAASMPARPVEIQNTALKSAPRLLGGVHATPAASIKLGALSEHELTKLRASNETAKYYQVGIGRSLNKMQRKIDLQGLAWVTTDDGTRYATLEFESSYAAAMRLGVAANGFPDGLTLYVYGTSLPNLIYGPYAAQDLRNASGTNGAPYWLPIIEGDTVRVELRVANGVSLDQAALTVPVISHLTQSARQDGLKNLNDIGRSGTCNIDIVCTPPSSAAWINRGNSVAKYYVTIASGVTGACTGTLVNSASSGTPPDYFITANHCIETTAAAASMHFYWFFQRSACNNPGTNPVTVTESVGATFINAVLANDTTLVRLNTTPPAGTILSGWNSSPIASGATMVTLHHPSADLKKYTDGRSQGFAAYRNPTPNNAGSHIKMVWDNGTTEGGSSGSGLFNANGEVVGVLTGGGASCSTLTSPDWYGRFDQAYPTLQPWLTPGPGGPPPPQPPPVPPSTALTSGVAVSNSVQLGEDIWYRIVTTASTTSVTVTLTNLSDDADLAVFRDSQNGTPVCVSESTNTSNESCTVAVTGGSTIYIDVYGYRAANYTVTATLVSPPPPLGDDVATNRRSGGGGGALGNAFLILLSTLLALQFHGRGRFKIALAKKRFDK